MLPADDPGVVALAEAINTGDHEGLIRLLAERPALATERIGGDHESRTALHLATDWPGHRPGVARTIELLVAAGAPLDGRFAGPHRETPLHWAASADDVAAIDALLAAGADIEAPGAVFTDGSPLSDAVVFAQWAAARRLVERGATMTIWQAAALGAADEVARQLDGDGAPLPAAEVTNACWHACRAGQLATARLLVAAGADLDQVGHDHLTARQAGLASGAEPLVAWLRSLG